jgi:phosphatidylglycerophosphatase A
VKLIVDVQPESDLDKEALRRMNETVEMIGISGCIIALADNIRSDTAKKYTDEIVARVAAAYLSAYLKAESDKR